MSNENIHILQEDAIGLLKQLIATPSFSKEEDKTSASLTSFSLKRIFLTKKHLQ